MRARTASETIHATTVAVGGKGVLLCGRSGSGKSDLALRLIDRGAELVADDYSIVSRDGGGLRATAPVTIANKLEVRGIGIVGWPAVDSAPIALCILLDDPVERMPEPEARRCYCGIDVPAMAFNPFEASTPIKIELALRTLKPVHPIQ